MQKLFYGKLTSRQTVRFGYLLSCYTVTEKQSFFDRLLYIVNKVDLKSFPQYKYKFTANEVTALMFVAKIGCWISLWLLLPLMKKLLKLSDSTTALVAIISTSTGFILPVCTNTSQWFKIGGFVGNWFTLSLLFCSLSPSLILIIR